ncbi:LOW QUALITY PROTEIN: protein BCAP [Guaruba guarouba]
MPSQNLSKVAVICLSVPLFLGKEFLINSECHHHCHHPHIYLYIIVLRLYRTWIFRGSSFFMLLRQGKMDAPPGETGKLCSLIQPYKKDYDRTTQTIQDGKYFTVLSKESDSLEHQLNTKNMDTLMQKLNENMFQNKRKILEREKQVKELTSRLQLEKANVQKGDHLSRSAKTIQVHLRHQIQRKEAENEELKEKIQTLQRKIAVWKLQFGEYKRQMLALKETSEQKKTALKKAVRCQKQRAQHFESAVEKLTSKIKEREVKLSEILSASSGWKKKHDRVVEGNTALEIQTEDLKKQITRLLEDLKRKEEWRRNSDEEILGKLKAVDSENEKIYLENEKLKASLATLEDSTVSFENELQNLPQKAKLQENLVEQYKNQVQELQTAMEELKSRCATALNERRIIEDKSLEVDQGAPPLPCRSAPAGAAAGLSGPRCPELTAPHPSLRRDGHGAGQSRSRAGSCVEQSSSRAAPGRTERAEEPQVQRVGREAPGSSSDPAPGWGSGPLPWCVWGGSCSVWVSRGDFGLRWLWRWLSHSSRTSPAQFRLRFGSRLSRPQLMRSPRAAVSPPQQLLPGSGSTAAAALCLRSRFPGPAPPWLQLCPSPAPAPSTPRALEHGPKPPEPLRTPHPAGRPRSPGTPPDAPCFPGPRSPVPLSGAAGNKAPADSPTGSNKRRFTHRLRRKPSPLLLPKLSFSLRTLRSSSALGGFHTDL